MADESKELTPEQLKAKQDAEQLKAKQDLEAAEAAAKASANVKKPEKKEELVKIRMKSSEKLKRQIIRPYIGKQWEFYAGKDYNVPKHVQESLAGMGYLEVL